MTRADEIVKELSKCVLNGDTEQAHSDADVVLINFIRELGYNNIADEWEKVDKWYA